MIVRILLDAVSGGQPLVLTRRGRLAAGEVDPDTWVEHDKLAEDVLETSA